MFLFLALKLGFFFYKLPSTIYYLLWILENQCSLMIIYTIFYVKSKIFVWRTREYTVLL